MPSLLRSLAIAWLVTAALAMSSMAQVVTDPDPGVPVGPDNSKSINDPTVPPAWPARGRPVARVDTPRECGSGFLISPDCFLTCAHVVSGQPADSIRLWFDYEDKTAPYERHRNCTNSPDSACSTPDVWAVVSVTILSPAESLDCALIRVANKGPRNAGDVYGWVTVRLDDPKAGEKVHVIHHPLGGCKEYSSDAAAVVINANDPDCGPAGWFSHGADTQQGSSGSPVFDDNGCVIGKHCGGIASVPKNCAVKMSAIRAGVEARGCMFTFCEKPVPATPTSWGKIKATYR